jgi:hypothetical protein
MDYLTNYYRNKAEALTEQIQNLQHQLQLMEAGAWSPSSGGPAIPESDAGNNELRDRMRQIKQSGNRPQSKEYLEMEAELNRRTGVNQPKPEAVAQPQAQPQAAAQPQAQPTSGSKYSHSVTTKFNERPAQPAAQPAAQPKAAPKQAAPAQPDRRMDGSDEGAPPARISAQGNQYSPKPDFVKGREQIDFVKNMFAPLKNIKPAQPDRRLDGSDEGAPPARVDAQGRQYSPMPDWVKEGLPQTRVNPKNGGEYSPMPDSAKNGQQPAPAPQGDTKVDTSKLYMGDDSWLKDATAPLTLPGSFAGDRTQQTGQPQSGSQQQNNGLFGRGMPGSQSLEQLSQQNNSGEALGREGNKLFYGKDVPSIKKSSGNSTKEGDSGTRIPSPRELMIGSPSDSAAPASEKRGLLGDLGNAFGNAAGALFNMPQSVNQALNRRVFVNK